MVVAMLLALQTAPTREAPPVLLFPTPGLDDPAAYEGYSARVYRDSRGNSVEIYIEAKTGRLVHLWADALNESIGPEVHHAAGFSLDVDLHRIAARIAVQSGSVALIRGGVVEPGSRKKEDGRDFPCGCSLNRED